MHLPSLQIRSLVQAESVVQPIEIDEHNMVFYANLAPCAMFSKLCRCALSMQNLPEHAEQSINGPSL